jgi:hypothetical protein
MRLLHSTTFELAEFVGDDTPPYAILSHTWATGEVSYSDMLQRDVGHRPGFAKLRGFCAQAARDGLDWVWADSCCIDKASSAELSEAINSMFSWYQNADVCYVYLHDVPSLDPFLNDDKFRSARWWSRGWCLQELIAPREVEFYSADWEEVGTKWSLQATITDITSIPTAILYHKKVPSDFSVAQRMSWASERQTTRVEDMAYCLFGLFDVNMPLMYGEGKKAFIRLQEEIMRREVDYSIFLWWSSSAYDDTGLLCDSPHYFPSTGVPTRSGELFKYSDLVPATVDSVVQTKPPEVTPRGLEMTMHTKEYEHGKKLGCVYIRHSRGVVCLILSFNRSNNKYYRTRAGCVEIVTSLAGFTGGDFEQEFMCMAIFTDLSVPRVPRQSMELKIWATSAAEETLGLVEVWPDYGLPLLQDGAYGAQVNLANCPDTFFLLFEAKRTSWTSRFIVVFDLFHGPLGCKICRYTEGVSLGRQAYHIMEAKPTDYETDRVMSRLTGGSYVTVSVKRRARTNRSHLHVALIPTIFAADMSMPRSVRPELKLDTDVKQQ